VNDGAMLEPHDHVFWCGQSTDDLYRLANSALAAGARRGEKLMFVAEEPDAERLGEIEGLEGLLERKQLELLEIEAVYGTPAKFDHDSQLATFEAVLSDALADGYTGIRVVADNTPFARLDEQGFRRWLRWEQVTDRFQAASNVTGICYFAREDLNEERHADLAALHPVRSAGSREPVFSFVVSGESIAAGGTLDSWSAEQFTRILETAPDDRPLVIDLSATEFVDHRGLLALNAAASAMRPVRIRKARPIIRELLPLLEVPTDHLHFD
jgi:hypothetical protein